MTIWRTWRVLVVAAAIAACGGSRKASPQPAPPRPDPVVIATPDPAPVPDPDALPPVPADPVARPDEVIAHAHVANVVASLTDVAAFADQVRPGTGGALRIDLLRQMFTQAGLDLGGVELVRPIHVLLLDPQQYPNPFVVVVTIGDRDALDAIARRMGWRVQAHAGHAALGTRDALIAAAGYALTTVVATPAPAQPTIEIEVATLVRRYEERLLNGMRQLLDQTPAVQRAMMAMSLDGYVAVLEQTARASIVLDADAARVSSTFRITPRPDTGLAAFVAAQRPGTFALVGELPAGTVAMGGALQLDAMWDYMVALSKLSFAQAYGNTDAAVRMFEQWRTLMTGENAAAVTLDAQGVTATALWDTDQPAAVAAAWRDYAQALAKTPLTGVHKLAIKPDAARHRGVKLSTMTTSPTATTPPDERSFYDVFGGKFTMGYGVAGDRFLLAAGGDTLRLLKAAIDRGAAKTRTVAPTLAPLLAELRQRRESYFVAVDVVGIRDFVLARMGAPTSSAGAAPHPPAVIAIGTDAGALTFRFTLPAAQLAPLL